MQSRAFVVFETFQPASENVGYVKRVSSSKAVFDVVATALEDRWLTIQGCGSLWPSSGRKNESAETFSRCHKILVQYSVLDFLHCDHANFFLEHYCRSLTSTLTWQNLQLNEQGALTAPQCGMQTRQMAQGTHHDQPIVLEIETSRRVHNAMRYAIRNENLDVMTNLEEDPGHQIGVKEGENIVKTDLIETEIVITTDVTATVAETKAQEAVIVEIVKEAGAEMGTAKVGTATLLNVGRN